MTSSDMAAGGTGAGRLRARRSCLAVPGSSPRFLEKAQGLPADQVFLDLEDACAPLVKESARHAIAGALNDGDWGGKTRVVRVNDWTTHWTYRDVITVVEGAGQNLDCLMLPKVQDAGQVRALDMLLTQIEKTVGLTAGRIGIEAQIEDARGLMNVDDIAGSSPRPAEPWPRPLRGELQDSKRAHFVIFLPAYGELENSIKFHFVMCDVPSTGE
jgi:citrate lyase subunit beta/citryl-CoA lyase